TPAFGQGAIAEAREAAFHRFLARGFPTTRDEEWKFTNVSPIAATAFSPAASAPTKNLIDPFLRDARAGCRIVVVNGRRQAELSAASLPKGVTLRGVEPADGLAVRPNATPFADLNTAFFQDAIVLEIASKAVVTEPIELLMIAVPSAGPALISPRIR